MENTKTLNALDEFAKSTPKEIPQALDEYLRYVASTGDPIYQWSLVKILFRQKLVNVVLEFNESSPMLDVPVSPNSKPFNFETVKKQMIERFEAFSGVPFTIQRIAELLTCPREQYSRLDKYMRALEKNIWVVSTRDQGMRDMNDSLVNGATVTNVLNNIIHNVCSPSNEAKRTTAENFDSEEDEDELSVTDTDATPALYTYTPVEDGLSEAPLNPIDGVSAELPPESAVTVETPVILEEEQDSLDTNENKTEGVTVTEIVSECDNTSSETTDNSNDPAPLISEPSSDDSTEIIQTAVSEVTGEESETACEDPILATTDVTDFVSEDKQDLKRKIEEVIGDDEEIPKKKQDIEHLDESPKLQPEVVEETVAEICATPEDEEAAPEAVNNPVEIKEDPLVQEEANEDTPTVKVASDENIETEQEAVEKLQAQVKEPESAPQEVTAIEAVESVVAEDKNEMVVEEPELPMDVDETSVTSPMVQDDPCEPMEDTNS